MVYRLLRLVELWSLLNGVKSLRTMWHNAGDFKFHFHYIQYRRWRMFQRCSSLGYSRTLRWSNYCNITTDIHACVRVRVVECHPVHASEANVFKWQMSFQTHMLPKTFAKGISCHSVLIVLGSVPLSNPNCSLPSLRTVGQACAVDFKDI